MATGASTSAVMDKSSDCAVCCDAFTKAIRKRIECPFCPYEVCNVCVRKYLLESMEDPHCMSCRHAWSLEFMDETFTKSFMNGEYKKHREDVLLDRERSLLPAAMIIIEHGKNEKIYLERLKKYKEEHKRKLQNLRTELNLPYYWLHQTPLPCSIEERKQNEKIYKEHLKKEKNKYNEVLQNMRIELNLPLSNQLPQVQNTIRRVFTRGCPAEGCRGFLSTQWKCGLCDIWVCPNCHEIKGAERDAPHECKPENVETAKLLVKDSRACPSCASMIHRVSGCDQMFCTMCHTAFEWSTGAICHGRIHNPHYFDMMRRRGTIPREIGDYGGNCEDIELIIRRNEVKFFTVIGLESLIRNLLIIIQNHADIDQRVLPQYQPRQYDTLQLRIDFLLNKKTETQFKKGLLKVEKRREYNREISMILTMYQTSMRDMLQRLLVMTKEKNVDKSVAEKVLMIWEEINNLRIYTNKMLDFVSKRFNILRVPLIKENWELQHNRCIKSGQLETDLMELYL